METGQLTPSFRLASVRSSGSGPHPPPKSSTRCPRASRYDSSTYRLSGRTRGVPFRDHRPSTIDHRFLPQEDKALFPGSSEEVHTAALRRSGGPCHNDGHRCRGTESPPEPAQEITAEGEAGPRRGGSGGEKNGAEGRRKNPFSAQPPNQRDRRIERAAASGPDLRSLRDPHRSFESRMNNMPFNVSRTQELQPS